MDKTTKFLLLACFILVGALAFTTGLLIHIWKEIPTTIQHNITNKTNTTNSNVSVNRTAKEWNVSFCPYCGAPFDRVEEIPYLIDANGIMHGHIYRVYKCGHRVYMGEKTWRFYNMDPKSQEYYRKYVKEMGGEVYY